MKTRNLTMVKDWYKGIDIPIRFLILQVFILSVITLVIIL
jgi:hypothetical protein